MKNWRIIVEILPGAIDAALEELASSMGFKSNVFSGVDTSILESAKYLTAVPIELALTSKDRETIMKTHPEVRYIITEVLEKNVDSMVSQLGYDLVEVADYIDPEDLDLLNGPVDILDKDTYYQVGGLTIQGKDIYDLLEVDPEKNPDSAESKKSEEVHERSSYRIDGKSVSRDEFFRRIPTSLKRLCF